VQICGQHAQRLSLRLDLRQAGVLDRVDALLAIRRPGPTPLRLQVLVEGVSGVVDLDGANAIRVDVDLINALRATPGVVGVKLALAKPWAH
jgi:DNA polymerase-3 subunit alpha